MKGKSILLALSGSKQSRYATEVCWRLAKQLDSTITAHHVVDAHSAWEFLGQDQPGFLNPSVYLEAYHSLLASLITLGEDLALSYAAEAKEREIDDVCIIDEGNPITEICRRAANHKMVVIGHKKSKGHLDTHTQFQRLSVAEALAHDCPRPLLVVQDPCGNWTSMSILISLDHINKVFIDSCLDMAETLNLKPTLLCVRGGPHEETANDFVTNIRASDERLKNIPFAMIPASKNLEVRIKEWYDPSGAAFDPHLWDNTLMAIPTRMSADERITIFDSSPSIFVRQLEFPSILLWPEEYVYSAQNKSGNKELSAVG